MLTFQHLLVPLSLHNESHNINSSSISSNQAGRMYLHNDSCQVHGTTPVLEVGLCVVCGLKRHTKQSHCIDGPVKADLDGAQWSPV